MSFEGKRNIYTCEVCFEHIVTVDRDIGVTPFLIECRCTPGCKGLMKSSLYRVFDQTMKPSYEWYQPSLSELSSMEAHVINHVNKGGLLLRKVKT